MTKKLSDSKHYWKNILKTNLLAIILLIVLAIGQLIFSLLPAPIFTWMIDEVLISKDMPLLLLAFVIVVITYSVNEIIKATFEFTYSKKMHKIIADLRHIIFRKVLRGTFSQFRSTDKPLLNILINDLNSLSHSGVQLIPQILLSSFIGIGAAIYLSYINIWFFLCVVVISFLSLYPIKKINQKQKVLVEQAQRKEVEQTNYIKEFYNKPLFVKTNYKISFISLGLNKIADQLFKSNIKRELNFRLFLVVRTLADSLLPTVIYGLGGYFYFTGKITIGEIVASISLILLINEPITRMSSYFLGIKDTIPRLKRVNEVIDQFDEIIDGEINLSLLKPKNIVVDFRNVSYEVNGVPILKNLNIRFSEETLLTGTSGVGKTTIFNMLMKLIEPTSGEIYINDIAYSTMSRNDVYSIFALIPQESIFFQGTIKENIMLINPNSTSKDIEKALYISCSEAFIQRFPNGIDTLLSENGMNLSGGERQRLAIARSLLLNTRYLLMDESFSALDPYIANTIYKRLKEEDRTLILISHRVDMYINPVKTIELVTPTLAV